MSSVDQLDITTLNVDRAYSSRAQSVVQLLHALAVGSASLVCLKAKQRATVS